MRLRKAIPAVTGVTLLAVATCASGTAWADVSGPQAFQVQVTCTGLGTVTVTNAGPSHTFAWQVVGSTTVILTAFPGVSPQPLVTLAEASGETCTEDGGTPVPVIIVHG